MKDLFDITEQVAFKESDADTKGFLEREHIRRLISRPQYYYTRTAKIGASSEKAVKKCEGTIADGADIYYEKQVRQSFLKSELGDEYLEIAMDEMSQEPIKVNLSKADAYSLKTRSLNSN